MSQFFDQASLVMVPSGYKDGKVYSQKPLSTDGELTFSRGSDIEATRVAANGYIEKAKVNLLLQSNTFSNAVWIKSAASVTGGQTGYDGSSDAWALTPTATSGSHRTYHSSVNSSGVVTCSVYAKANGYSHLFIYANTASGDDRAAWFDLSGGSVGTQTNKIVDATITSVGGGWYRCDVKQDNTLGLLELYVGDGENISFTGNGTSGILIQDAQVNYGLVAQDYVETTTTSVVSGITNDMPRLDYSGGASCPSLLLEPSRTNIQSYSEYFGGSYYVIGSGVSVVDNNYTSPEGVLNGAKLTGAIGTTRSGDVITRVMSVSSSTTYTASIYVYKDTATQCTLYLRDGSTGVVVSESVTLEEGWQRIDKSITTGASTSQMNWYLGNTDGDIGIYGAQIEAGSYSTSLIPTYGTSATRTADFANKGSISSLFGATEGTFFCELTYTNTNSIPIFLQSSVSSSFNQATYLQLGGNKVTYNVYSGGAQQVGITSTSNFTEGQSLKIAIVYKADDFAMYINGVAQGSVSSGSISNSLTAIQIGRWNDAGATFQYFGRLNQALLFKTRLSNSDLAALTA